MNEKNELKKYFIKDAELTVIDQDKLDYKEIVKNLEMIIDNTETPYTIALTGKSGIGKSSIINFLTNKYKDNPEEYNVEKVNVWKEKVSIKEYVQSNFSKKDDILTVKEKVLKESETSEGENTVEENNSFVGKKEKKPRSKIARVILALCNIVLTFVACLFLTSIVFVIMEYFQNKDIYRTNDIFFVENTYLNYSENIGLIMLFSLLLTGIAIVIYKLFIKKDRDDIHSKKSNEKDVNEDVTINEQEIIDSDGSLSTVKNIVIIEDIDKLSVAKMLKALEEIKYCNEYENCVFIVPINKTSLKKAIEVRNIIKPSPKYKPLKFDKVLDKIFQFKVHVPVVSSSKFKEYAVNMVKESIPDFIDEYSEDDIMEGIIRNILIYKNVTTPRHLKKLVNNFVNNKILAYQRYESGKLEAGLINTEKFDYQLAKISVLQSDFEEFYDLIFKDFSYLDKLSELYCLSNEKLEEEYDNIDDDLKVFFKAKYNPLKCFLRQTKNYTVDEIVTIMYLTKNITEELYKGKPISSYIMGNGDLSNWSNEEVLELIKLIDNKNDLKDFSINNFGKMLDNLEMNIRDAEYFKKFNDNVYKIEDNIEKADYLRYLKLVADNFELYPEEALQIFKYSKFEITGDIMSGLFIKLENNLKPENYQDTFEVISENSDCFYEENGNISGYVHFLVDYIYMSPNPDEVITELDENFTRIGKVYELNKNIKNLENCNLDNAYAFMAKCLDNGDLSRMKYVINRILSDENSIKDCLRIEEKMTKYNLVDIIESNVDDLIDLETAKLEIESNIESNTTEDNANSNESSDTENADSIENNYILLENLVELCVIKQIYLNASDVMKVVEKALSNIDNIEYILSIYDQLKKLDRMYFYEIRRDFNDVIYASFHTAKNDNIRKAALNCTRYFKNTRLFKTKLTEAEEQFYSEN